MLYSAWWDLHGSLPPPMIHENEFTGCREIAQFRTSTFPTYFNTGHGINDFISYIVCIAFFLNIDEYNYWLFRQPAHGLVMGAESVELWSINRYDTIIIDFRMFRVRLINQTAPS